MKKIYLFAIASIVVLTSRAQYTITASSSPVIGDANQYYYTDTTGVDGGASGTGQTWDYTNLVIASTPTLIIDTYTTVTSTPNGTDFPTSNFAISHSDGPGDYSYFNYSSTQTELNGISLSSSNPTFNVIYSDPETMYTLPFSYGSSATDNFAASFTMSGTPVNMSGTVTVAGDGTGILNLPNGKSYSNVLMLKTVEYTNTTDGTCTGPDLNPMYK